MDGLEKWWWCIITFGYCRTFILACSRARRFCHVKHVASCPIGSDYFKVSGPSLDSTIVSMASFWKSSTGIRVTQGHMVGQCDMSIEETVRASQSGVSHLAELHWERVCSDIDWKSILRCDSRRRFLSGQLHEPSRNVAIAWSEILPPHIMWTIEISDGRSLRPMLIWIFPRS